MDTRNAQPFSDAAGDAIKRLLRKIDTGDEYLLDSRQRQFLRQLLFPVRKFYGKALYDLTLVREVLRTLEVQGTQADALAIQRLTKTSHLPQELHDFASTCLAHLEERLSLQQTNDTLLRASTSVTSSNEMLRASHGITQSTSEETAQLLRPTLEQDKSAQDKVVYTEPASVTFAEQPAPQEQEQLLHSEQK